MRWQEQAACRGMDSEYFALASNEELGALRSAPHLVPRIKRALRICANCAVRQQCDQFARGTSDIPLVGVWGGQYVGFKEADSRRRAAKAADDARRAAA